MFRSGSASITVLTIATDGIVNDVIRYDMTEDVIRTCISWKLCTASPLSRTLKLAARGSFHLSTFICASDSPGEHSLALPSAASVRALATNSPQGRPPFQALHQQQICRCVLLMSCWSSAVRHRNSCRTSIVYV
jgi:hypothetical protein